MTDQITLEEALKLVEFEFILIQGAWRVKHVKCDVWGAVWGTVWGTISGRKWQFIETPREKLKRLIDEGANKEELLAVVHQLEDSDD